MWACVHTSTCASMCVWYYINYKKKNTLLILEKFFYCLQCYTSQVFLWASRFLMPACQRLWYQRRPLQKCCRGCSPNIVNMGLRSVTRGFWERDSFSIFSILFILSLPGQISPVAGKQDNLCGKYYAELSMSTVIDWNQQPLGGAPSGGDSLDFMWKDFC